MLARNFGGDLEVLSMHRYGTDCLFKQHNHENISDRMDIDLQSTDWMVNLLKKY